ncbi:SRP40, C-terminal domain-containing protein [Besnoitia besnoiti]|uniref:SRP40, C-terminal domain-containing protein n=1 Tax=Besnoitia besnoiti TaxID=94643 RepID=A0A2A9M3W2_BESBE|nr:SRP40, C-terminal domain-containing protein [Besnoitia besnoiti]PFH31904.1 SRP40, C-terminal domain-containing protein [Besnoitia besnoiti]
MAEKSASHGTLLLSVVSFLESLGLRKAAKALRKEASAQMLAGEEELFPGETLPEVVAAGLAGEKKKKKRQREVPVEEASDAAPAAEEPKKKKKGQKEKKRAKAAAQAAEEEQEEDKEPESSPPKKTVKDEEEKESDEDCANGSDVHTDTAYEGKSKKGKSQKQSSVTQRFKRIDESKWVGAIKKEDLKDNSFWNKKDDSFAVKAAQDLGKVRGRDFRHEKTKKKRASWRGCGEIPMGVNSIQFESSDDE